MNRAMRNGLAAIATICLLPGPAIGDDRVRNYVLNVPANAMSIDFTNKTGALSSAKNDPVVKDPSHNPVPFSGTAIGGAGDKQLLNFATPLAAGKYTLTLYAPDNITGVQVWYDFNGKPVDFTTPSVQQFASLNLDMLPGQATIVGENQVGTATATVGTITATVITGLSSIDSPNWDTIPGTDMTFAGGTIPTGASGVNFGSLNVASDQWVRLATAIGGDTQVAGFAPASIPEPSTLLLSALLGMGGVACCWCRRGSAS